MANIACWCGLLLVVAVGCAKGPFLTTIDTIDEESPQQNAAIQISDAQVYARETLVNDRRTEVVYLTQVLEESKQAVFEPQVRRDIRSLSAFSGELSIALDPAKGQEFERSKQVGDLEQKVRLTQLQTQLAEEQAKLSKAQQGTNDSPSQNPQPPVAPTPPPPAVTPPSTSAITSRLDALISELKTQLSTDTTSVKKVSVQGTPAEVFADRQAYRASIRAAMAAVNLDDLHDFGGNSLYRLQFRATVVPGQNKNKWGVARLTVEHPMLDEEDLRRLYLSWLSHSTYRMNQVVRGEILADPTYQALASTSEFFSVLQYPIPAELTSRRASCQEFRRATSERLRGLKSLHAFEGERALPLLAEARDAECEFIRLVARTGVATNLQPFFIDPSYTQRLYDALSIVLRRVEAEEGLAERFRLHTAGTSCVFVDREFARTQFEPSGLTPEEAFRYARQFVEASASLAAAFQGLGDRRFLPDHAKAEVSAVLDRLPSLIAVSRSFIALLVRANVNNYTSDRPARDPCKLVRVGEYVERGRRAPNGFRRVLVKDNPLPDVCVGCKADGSPYAYATAPVELGQTLSTYAGAANATSLALALAAAHPGSGLSGSAAMGYLRNAVGRVEALERAPLVVGFSHRSPKLEPQLGWLFGPRIVLDPKGHQLKLVQTVSSQSLAAEVSLPAWWPRAELRLETAWVGNWYEASSFDLVRRSLPVEPQKVSVPLPLNRANLDSLTSLVAGQTVGIGLQQTRIARVEPASVSACLSKEITFLVYGANVWRSTDVYFAGSRAKSVTVLPDMEGVSATFDPSSMSGLSDGAVDIPLTAWTRNGVDSFDLNVRMPQGGKCTETADKAK